jgi:hypothetical protein
MLEWEVVDFTCKRELATLTLWDQKCEGGMIGLDQLFPPETMLLGEPLLLLPWSGSLLDFWAVEAP